MLRSRVLAADARRLAVQITYPTQLQPPRIAAQPSPAQAGLLTDPVDRPALPLQNFDMTHQLRRGGPPTRAAVPETC